MGERVNLLCSSLKIKHKNIQKGTNNTKTVQKSSVLAIISGGTNGLCGVTNTGATLLTTVSRWIGI